MLKELLLVGVGVGIGCFMTKKHYEQFHSERADAEIEDIRMHYSGVAQAEIDKSEKLEAFYRDLLMEKPVKNPPGIEPGSDVEKVVLEYQGVGSKKQNISVVREEPRRKDDSPFIIGKDEFLKGYEGFEQYSMTWFAGDHVLVGENDKKFDQIDLIVGNREYLNRFGGNTGSGDPEVLYIRNLRLTSDFEIIRSMGKYSVEVLGEDDDRSGDDA